MPPDERVEDRLDERTQRETIVHRDEVDRPAHDADPNRRPVEERRFQLGRRKAVDAGAKCDVRVARHLCLQPDELANHVERRPLDALEQVLPRQRRAVQLAVGQDGAQLPVVEKCW